MISATRVKQGLVVINPANVIFIERGTDDHTTRIYPLGGIGEAAFFTIEGDVIDIQTLMEADLA